MGEFLRVDALRMEFGGLVAVKEVSFTVGEGEFVGLISLGFNQFMESALLF